MRAILLVLVSLLFAGTVRADNNDAIHIVVKRRAKDFRTCWQRELNKDPAAAKGGKIVIAVVLEENGKVKTARVASTTMNYKPTEDCVVKTMKELVFPAEAPRTFDYPFLFTQGG